MLDLNERQRHRENDETYQLDATIIIVASNWYVSSFSYMMHGHTYIKDIGIDKYF